MKIAVFELNELALVVSNFFKDFDPETMFWDYRSPAIFPNYNHRTLKTCKDLRKPFGTQAVLESFARSLGFNTFNGLLESKRSTVDLKSNALSFLNPNKLSSYYTNAWQYVTEALMANILSAERLPSKVARNFKSSELAKSLHLVRSCGSFFGMLNLDQIAKNSTENVLKSPKLTYLYPIVQSIFCFGVELAIEKMKAPSKKAKSNDQFEHITFNLKQVMVRDQLGVQDPELFFKNITTAMQMFFYTEMNVVGGSKFDDCQITLHLDHDVIEAVQLACLEDVVFKSYRAFLEVLIQEHAQDTQLYQCFEYQGQNGFKGLNLIEVQLAIDASKSRISAPFFREAIAPYGTKSYWINIILGLKEFQHAILIHDDHDFEADALSFAKKAIRFIEELIPYEAKKLPNQKTYDWYDHKQHFQLKALDGNSLVKYPSNITVISSDALRFPLGELFVQRELLQHIDRGFIYSKQYGHPRIFREFNDYINKDAPRIEILRTQTATPNNMVLQFDPLAIITQMRVLWDTFHDEVKLYGHGNVQDYKLFYAQQSKVYFCMNMKFTDSLCELDHTHDCDSDINTVVLKVCIDQANFHVTTELYDREGVYSHLNPETKAQLEKVCESLGELDDLRRLIRIYAMQFYQMNELTKERYEKCGFSGRLNGYVILPSLIYDCGWNIHKEIYDFVAI